METWIDDKIVFSGKIFAVRTGTVRLDDGRTAEREVVENPGGVGIVPVLNDEVILVRQFRIAVNREIVEIPAGRLEEGETPESCAGRELEEEIGYRADKLIPVSSYYSSAGFSNERMYLFLGLDLGEVALRPEWDERLQIVRIPIAEIGSKLRNGEFEDAKTIIGLYALLSYLEGKAALRS
ncbi:MAG TPA: NUDIX hydrolase [Anaerolineae bacterium]